MTTLSLPTPAAGSTSSARLLETAPAPLGWQHMPGFGSGYRDFASRSIPWPALPTTQAPSTSDLPHDNFWSSVARHQQA